MPKTWFITGASRGLGVEISKAALRAGDRVVATGRRKTAVAASLGPDSDSLLSLELDVTKVAEATIAVEAAVARFARIDVLVNNAGYGQMGFFEENSLEGAEAQFAANLFGVMNVTWAALPVMRAARQGRIFNISSIAGIRGSSFASMYCASKFALEGFSEALAQEIQSFGLFLTLVEPGPFRTDFLGTESLRMGDRVVADYDPRRPKILGSYQKRNGRQPGDPVKLAEAVVRLANEEKPPLRFAAGVMAADSAVAKLAEMRAEFDHWRELSVSLDYDE